MGSGEIWLLTKQLAEEVKQADALAKRNKKRGSCSGFDLKSLEARVVSAEMQRVGKGLAEKTRATSSQQAAPSNEAEHDLEAIRTTLALELANKSAKEHFFTFDLVENIAAIILHCSKCQKCCNPGSMYSHNQACALLGRSYVTTKDPVRQGCLLFGAILPLDQRKKKRSCIYLQNSMTSARQCTSATCKVSKARPPDLRGVLNSKTKHRTSSSRGTHCLPQPVPRAAGRI